MKKLCYGFVFGMMIMLFASSTRADVADPRIGGGDGSCASFSLGSLTQQNTIPTSALYAPSGPCIVDFVNNTDPTITSVTVTVDTPFDGTLSCYIIPGPSHFTLATLIGPNSCEFSGGSVPVGDLFGFQFGDAVHPFCAPGSTVANCIQLTGLDITLHANPEPATITLIGTGLAALVARKKKLGNKPLALPNCVC
jgi:PEP-CTERM motif